MGTQYKVMVGSDSSVYFSLEDNSDEGKILNRTVDDLGFVKNEYPILERRTGHSIKGTTESIESAEIRKGRTKSAPRKGNSSSEGSLDIELSPQSYDDIFEAALRGEWQTWESDYGDTFVNKDSGVSFVSKDGKFLMKTSAQAYAAKRLVASSTESGANALIVSDACDFAVSQLKVGTTSKMFDAVVEYGGPYGSLYQDFEHLAVNTMSLSVSPGQIVTGSFGFMGSNNPNLEQIGDLPLTALTSTYTAKDGETYYQLQADGSYKKVTKTKDTAVGTDIFKLIDPVNFNAVLKNRFNDTSMNAYDVHKWIENLEDVVETTTDQYTAREGFLIVNGTEIDYGSNLTFELNNGLKKLFAIFRPDAISNPAMTLDVTGTLDAYLIKGHTETLVNYSTEDTDVELIFSFQDREKDPENIYVFQIFKTKLDKDFGGGSDELTVSLPYTSFEERAVRIFRLKKRTVRTIVCEAANNQLKVNIAPDKVPADYDYTKDSIYPTGNTVPTGFTCDIYENGTKQDSYKGTMAYSKGIVIVPSASAGQWSSKTLTFKVEYNGLKYEKTYTL